MAQYDGSIRINTKIDTKGFKDGEKEIESESRRAANSVSNSVKSMEKELESIEKGMWKTAQEITSLTLKMNQMRDLKLPTEEYKEVQTQIENTEKKINDLVARQEKFLATGGKESSSTYQRIQYDIDELKASLPYMQSELQDLVESGKAFTLGSDTNEFANLSNQIEDLTRKMQSDGKRQSELQSALAAEEQRIADIKERAVVSNQEIINKVERIKQLEREIADLKTAERTIGYKDYDDRIAELSRLKQEVRDYNSSIENTKRSYKKLGDTAKKSFEKINKSAKKSNGLLGTMATRFKGLALSLLIFNQISKAFRALTQGIKEGFGNLYNEVESFKNAVDSLKASSLTLKNSFAAAFRPLVEMAIPYIQKAVEWLTVLTDRLGQFIALAMGQKTYTRAVKQTAAALKEAGKAANGYLNPLDEINQFTPKEDTEGAVDSGKMFEEVPLDGKLPEFFNKIAEYANSIKDIFAKGFWDGLGDWEYRWESIQDSIKSIKKSLMDIWTDQEVLNGADNWAKSVAYMLGSLVGAVASIGLTIGSNFIGGISLYLEQNKERIKGYLVSMFDIWTEINGIFSELFQSIGYVFEAFASEQGKQLTANIIGIFSDTFMGITELASRLFRDISNIIIQPFVDNKEKFRTALEGFLSVLSKVTGTIKQGIDDTFAKLNEIYDEHFKPFFDSIATGLSDTVGKFMDFWNESVQPILEEWAAGFDKLWKEHIQPALNKFIELLGDSADFLKAVWENVIKPFVDWVIEKILPVILPIIDGVVKALGSAAGMIADIIGGIMDVIGGILEFLTGVFTGDWKKAWDGIVKIFDGVGGAIKGIVNGILGFVESLANGVVNAINTVIRALNRLSFDIPSWVPLIGGNHFGFNIPELSRVSIPRLATGTVVPPNREFMAVLGDNKREPEVVSPISTMKQAVMEAIAESGGIGSGKPVNITLQVSLDRKVLGQAMVDWGKLQQMATGNNPYNLGTT